MTTHSDKAEPLTAEELEAFMLDPGDAWECTNRATDDWLRSIAATITQAQAERDAARELVTVPGQWRCAKCKFVVHKMVLCASTGNVGVKTDTKTEPCPNGCGPLWPVTA